MHVEPARSVIAPRSTHVQHVLVTDAGDTPGQHRAVLMLVTRGETQLKIFPFRDYVFLAEKFSL